MSDENSADRTPEGIPAWMEKRPPRGHYPIQPADVPALDKTAMMPVKPPAKLVLRAAKKLGLSDKVWDRAKLMATQELSRYMTMKVTARILLVRNLTAQDQAESAMAWAQSIISSTDKQYTTQDRLAAMQMMTLCMKGIKDLNAQQMELSEKGADKVSTERTRNLPPSVAVQVNLAGANPSPAPANPAISGTLRQEHAGDTPN